MSITGPDEDFLDKAAVIAILKLTGEEQLFSLIEQGLFPPPVAQPLHKTRAMWRALDVACFWWNQSRGCMVVPEADRKYGAAARARKRGITRRPQGQRSQARDEKNGGG